MDRDKIGDIKYRGKHVCYMLLLYIILFSILHSYWYLIFVIFILPLRTYYNAKQYMKDANISFKRKEDLYHPILEVNYSDYLLYNSCKNMTSAFKTMIKGKKKIEKKREKTKEQYKELIEDILLEFEDISLFKNIPTIESFTEDIELAYPLTIVYIINEESNTYVELYEKYKILIPVADDIFLMIKNKLEHRKYFSANYVQHEFLALQTPNLIRSRISIEVLK